MHVDDATTYVGCNSHKETFPCISGTDEDDSMQEHDSSAEAAGNLAESLKYWSELKYVVGLGQLPEFSKHGWQMITWKNVDGYLKPGDETPCTATIEDQFGHSHKIK